MKGRSWGIIGERVAAARQRNKETGEPVDIALNFDLIEIEIARDGLGPTKVLCRTRYLPGEHNVAHAADGLPINPAILIHGGIMFPGNGATLEVLEVGSDVKDLKAGDIVALQCCGEPDEFGNPRSIFGYDTKGVRGVYGDIVEVDAFQLIPLPDVNVPEPVIAAASLRLPTAVSNADECLHMLQYKRRAGGLLVPADNWVLGFGGAVTEVELLYTKSLGYNAIFCSGTAERREEMANRGVHVIDQNAFNRFVGKDGKPDRDQTKAFRANVKEMTGGKYASVVIDFIGGAVFDAAVQACGRNAVHGTAGWQLGPGVLHPRATACVTRMGQVSTHYASRAEAIHAMSLLTPQLSPLVHPTEWSFEQLPQMIKALHENQLEDGTPLKGVPYVNCLLAA
jgi:NADPH:quinone reductase-like Zn-dependent oxidoreductase